MKYFKSKSGEVFAYEADGSQDKFIPDGLTPISESEAQAMQSPQPTSDELASAARAKRDALLAASDWVVLRAQETGEPVPDEWLKYRRALRDVPGQKGFPAKIKWPVQPDAK